MRWGRQGAGALLVACTTGRLLLTLRSAEVLEPHTWGLPGGRVEPGETPMDAAVRELREELSYRGDLLLVPSYVYEESSFRYHNFVALVPKEFGPRLNWENDDAQWFDASGLPEPLHFGVERLMAEAGGEIPTLLKQCAGL